MRRQRMLCRGVPPDEVDRRLAQSRAGREQFYLSEGAARAPAVAPPLSDAPPPPDIGEADILTALQRGPRTALQLARLIAGPDYNSSATLPLLKSMAARGRVVCTFDGWTLPPATLDERILRAITGGSCYNPLEVAGLTGEPVGEVRTALQRLVDAGHAQCETYEAPSGECRVYSATD